MVGGEVMVRGRFEEDERSAVLGSLTTAPLMSCLSALCIDSDPPMRGRGSRSTRRASHEGSTAAIDFWTSKPVRELVHYS